MKIAARERRSWRIYPLGLLLMCATATVTVYGLLVIGDLYTALDDFGKGLLSGFAISVGIVIAILGGRK